MITVDFSIPDNGLGESGSQPGLGKGCLEKTIMGLLFHDSGFKFWCESPMNTDESIRLKCASQSQPDDRGCVE